MCVLLQRHIVSYQKKEQCRLVDQKNATKILADCTCAESF